MRYYDEIDANLFLGRECLKAGQSDRAVASLSRATDLLPGYVKARIYLAAALASSGRYRAAAQVYISTAGARPPLVILEERILPAFARWAQEGSPESLYWYGVVARQYGRFEQARQSLARAVAAGYPAAADELRSLHDTPPGARQP
jgi:tetratricopeptide (TPR) repeat protein